MTETFGNADLSNGEAAKTLHINLGAEPLELSWQHCGTTSDFLGEYFAKCCEKGVDQVDARHSIGYLLNEILENAVKFRHKGNVEIRCSMERNVFESTISNMVDPQTAEKFQALLQELLSRDPGELLLERIEANASDAGSGGSGLGLLTLMNDYDARLGWSFRSDHANGTVHLHTVAALTFA
ncbi:ATP-binding protein [Roseibium denhamense]|uniref:ATP-binding protein n=1 Tax=Roseibium denhamense TaxID=76305 RepID=A0ABY1NX03_9HYPH|nr:ATP-binding protein [Roseibium denhamense]MTI04878.1 ATP-binding protein [Roseibium denhamense]SMP20553.1 hypothetical protein SAMN06265374_2104 [Roseibium denhamense]